MYDFYNGLFFLAIEMRSRRAVIETKPKNYGLNDILHDRSSRAQQQRKALRVT